MESYRYTNFQTRDVIEESFTSDDHGGGDWNLVADWIHAVSKQDESLLTSTIEVSIESHIMGFEAETSRKTGTVRDVKVS